MAYIPNYSRGSQSIASHLVQPRFAPACSQSATAGTNWGPRGSGSEYGPSAVLA